MSKSKSVTVRVPFESASILARGAYAYVYTVLDEIAVKFPVHFEPGADAFTQRMSDESVEVFEYERSMFKQLRSSEGPNHHPNFVQSFLIISDAIFMSHEKESLWTRLQDSAERPITQEMRYRWIRQIVSAASWLERLDYFHTHLRPFNILLNSSGHVKLCDFGNMTKRGEPLPGATEPYYRLTPEGDSPLVGPTSEQFAVASCIYTVQKGHEPLHHLSDSERVDALIRGDLPSTLDDLLLGDIVGKCWRGEFLTLHAVGQAVELALQDLDCADDSSVMSQAEYDHRLKECHDFIKQERGATDGPENKQTEDQCRSTTASESD